MKFAVFEIASDYAHFKTPESTRGNFTFPFPPRTAIIGLIAGILGIERNSYWMKENPLFNTKIALEIVNPIIKDNLKVLYSHTRTITSFSSIGASISIMIPKDPGNPTSRGFITPFKLDILRDVKYRIYVSIDNEKLFAELVSRFESKKYTYPPYLGHANFLAIIDFIGTFEGKILPEGNYEIDGIIPASTLLDEKDLLYSAGGLMIVFNVPMVMIATKNQKYVEILPETYSCSLARMENIIMQIEDDKSNIKLNLKDRLVFEIKIDGSKKRLAILPNESMLEKSD
ncbi:MAG: type I-B CRISPR-associated protein Cas5b [Candidatus Heimdallarchaeota archaeon]